MHKVFFVLGAALLCGCSQNAATTAGAQRAAGPKVTAPANGRMIFLTGKDSEGFRINAAHPPLRTSCAACHRANGSGGVHLPGGAVSADLRRKALSEGAHPYTLLTLERAISTGIDNENKPLDPVMPKWQMTPRDLHDVAAYVMTLH